MTVGKLLRRDKILLHSESRSMHVRKNSRTGALISFTLMRPEWIPATSSRNAGNGEETPGVILCKHGQRIIVVHRCQPS